MAHSKLTRSVRLYPIYAPIAQAHFWLPVFFLFFNQHMTIDRVLRLEAIYYVAVVILEVPSGYLSDTLGRRLTLLISTLSAVLAYILFFAGHTFGVFVLAQIGLAASVAFRSGTDTSFHYDLLACLGREAEYAGREARITRNVFVASAGAALMGGLVGIYALRLAYCLSLLAACVAFALVFAFAEPSRDPKRRGVARGFFSQIRACLAYLAQPALAWLMSFSVFMTVINHIPYEFYQPYIDLLRGQHAAPTPLVTGCHTALTMVIAAWFAKRSVRLSDYLGTRLALMLSAGIQGAIIWAMSVFLHPIVALLLGFRSVPRALMIAPLNVATVPRLQRHHRATYLSIQSLIGRLAFSLGLVLLASSASPTLTGADAIFHPLRTSAVFALAGCAVLAIVAVLIPGAQWRLIGEKRSAD